MREHSDTTKHILFDLDETIYRADTGLMDLMSRRISDYMISRLGMDSEIVKELRSRYYEMYGTTSRGLCLHHNVDSEDYFHFVHDVPIEKFLKPNGRLDRMLAGLEPEKVIFTNATAEHARRVLQALGIERHFGRIIDIRDLEHMPKPNIEAYYKALELLNARPEECMLVEDRPRNLKPGKELGMTTVLVGDRRVAEQADFVIEDLTELGELVKQIRSQKE